jgi:hypothetical protein
MPIAVMRPAIHAHCLGDLILEVIGFLVTGSPISKGFGSRLKLGGDYRPCRLPARWGETLTARFLPIRIWSIWAVLSHGIGTLLYLQLHLYGLRSARGHNFQETPFVTPIFQLW